MKVLAAVSIFLGMVVMPLPDADGMKVQQNRFCIWYGFCLEFYVGDVVRCGRWWLFVVIVLLLGGRMEVS